MNQSELLPDAQQLLETYRDAFLLGSTAPDLQTVSAQARAETHFFKLPYRDQALQPWEQLFFSYPELRSAWSLSPAQAAFMAGYLCHLQADWLWILEIFLPNFEFKDGWVSYNKRIYYHNVLRAYMDTQISQHLSKDVCYLLSKAVPEAWLPFAKDSHIIAWRNILTEQFIPGSTSKTVEVFAARQGVSPIAFYRLLNSEELMEEHIFQYIPRQRLTAYQALLISANLRLLRIWFA